MGTPTPDLLQPGYDEIYNGVPTGDMSAAALYAIATQLERIASALEAAAESRPR